MRLALVVALATAEVKVETKPKPCKKFKCYGRKDPAPPEEPSERARAVLRAKRIKNFNLSSAIFICPSAGAKSARAMQPSVCSCIHDTSGDLWRSASIPAPRARPFGTRCALK